jgi:hypothetical protein
VRWSGRDLLPRLAGRGELAPADLYADLFVRQRAVMVDGRWKAILARRRHQKAPRDLEVYDLLRDRLEQQDLEPDESVRAAELKLKLERAYRAFRRASAGVEAGRVRHDPEFERELRALGYL